MEIYINRDIENLILDRLEAGFIVGLLGARQTGKTTVMNRIREIYIQKGIKEADVFFFNLDDVLLRNQITSDFYFIRNSIERSLGKNLKSLTSPIILMVDEAQKAPDVFELIKILHDNFKKKIKILISGSASLEIQRKGAESLTGRISYLHLYPFSINELLRHRFSIKTAGGIFQALAKGKLTFDYLKNIQSKVGGGWERLRELNLILEMFLLDGGLPAIWQKKEVKEVTLRSFVDTYLDKDIRAVKDIGSIDDFGRLTTLCAYETGRLLNISNISRDLGIAVNTIKKYLSILGATFVISRLPSLNKRNRKRFVKNQKIFYFDTGIVNFLTKRKVWEHIKGEEAGFLFENLLFNSILSYNINLPMPDNLSFWRDYQGHEVDLVIEQREEKIPVEMTLNRSVTKEKIRNMRYFFEEFKEATFGLVIYKGELKQMNIGKRPVYFIPWWLWL